MLTAGVAVVGLPVAASSLYLMTLAVASHYYRRPPTAPGRAPRLLVLIPAHNEAELIGGCLRSLRDQNYPGTAYRIAVIADNCTDRTADVARAAGADVMVRDDPAARGKGHALRWAIDRVLSNPVPPDGVVIIDADTVADRDLLQELAGPFAAGCEVVQGNDLILSDGSSRAALEGAALGLRNGVRFAGRAVLGLPATLCGNGMLIGRRVLEQHPWGAFTATEDGEYSLMLRMAGVKTTFTRSARLYAIATSGEAGAYTQGVRWEAGRFHLARRWLLPMVVAAVAQQRWDLLGDALDLAVLPFSLLAIGTYAGLGGSLLLVAAGALGAAAVLPWAVAAVLLPGYIVVGLRAARAPATVYRAILRLAPTFAVRKLRIYLRVLRGFEMTQWIRTARPAESEGRPAPQR